MAKTKTVVYKSFIIEYDPLFKRYTAYRKNGLGVFNIFGIYDGDSLAVVKKKINGTYPGYIKTWKD